MDLDKVKLVSSQSKKGIQNAITARNKEFKQRNIVTKDILVPVKDSEGNVIIDSKTGKPVMRVVTTPISIPEEEKEATKLFIDSYKCWFEGCQELRDAYKKELASLGDASCVPCKKGAIWRKYIRKTVEAIKSQRKDTD